MSQKLFQTLKDSVEREGSLETCFNKTYFNKVRKTENLGRNHEDLIFFFNEAFIKFVPCTFNIRRRGEKRIVFFWTSLL